MRNLTTLPMMTAAAMCCAPAAFAGDVWDGGSAVNDYWTTGLNWNLTLQGQVPPPNNGTANLSFPCFGGVVHQPLIDVPYSINSLTFGSGSGRYVVLGAAMLTVGAGGIVNNDADIQSVIGTVKLAANQSWNAAAGPLGFDAVDLNGFQLTCTGDFPIGLPSVIVGAGGVNVSGGIQVTMSGGANNTYTGSTDAHNGTLLLQKTGGALAVPGNLTINESEPATPATVRLAGNEQISHALNHMVHVYPGGLLDVNTRTETLDTLWLDGGDAVTTGGGRLNVRNAHVEGSTASWINSSLLMVGDAATGWLSILSGGDVTSEASYIGRLASASGAVTVSGNGSTWNTGTLLVGEYGSGTLSILAGAHVSASGHSYVGLKNGSTGEVTVDGTGSTWTPTGVLNVGFDNSTGGGGDATVNVRNNAAVDVGVYVWIGAGDQINVTSGGTLNVTDEIEFFGGSLTADTNAAVTCAGGTMQAGASAIAQNDATLTMSNQFVIHGGATMDVTSGATLMTSSQFDLQGGSTMEVTSGATFSSYFTRVGTTSGIAASLMVDGAGTLATTPGCCIDIGYGGAGVMAVTGGAHVESLTGAVGSFGVNSVGTLILDGTDVSGNPSSWIAQGGPNMGLHATSQATVHILNGAVLSTGGLNLGDPGSATVLVSGADGSGDPSLFQAGLVTLAAAPGATAAVTASMGGRIEAANMALAPSGGAASLTITDPDSTVVQSGASTITVGHASIGSAEINVQNNASFVTGTGAININATGEINIASGGVFDARGPITLNSGGEFNFLGGTLHVDAFNGNLLNQAGTLAPGHSPGLTAISGNYTQQAGATLQIEIGGIFPGDWDEAIVQGNALVDGTLHIVLIDGFQPVTGNTFTILTTNVGNVAGTFDTLIAPSGMEVTYSPHAITLTMTSLPCPADVSPNGGDGAVNINDLLEVINGWGSCAVPCPPRCAADISPIPAGDCQININDLLEVINSWGPCP